MLDARYPLRINRFCILVKNCYQGLNNYQVEGHCNPGQYTIFQFHTCYLHVHLIYLRPMPDFTEGGGQDHSLLARLSALEARAAAQPKDPAQGDAIPRDGMSMIFMIKFCV